MVQCKDAGSIRNRGVPNAMIPPETRRLSPAGVPIVHKYTGRYFSIASDGYIAFTDSPEPGWLWELVDAAVVVKWLTSEGWPSRVAGEYAREVQAEGGQDEPADGGIA